MTLFNKLKKGGNMNKPIIRRYFSDDIFNVIKDDFAFLVKKIVESGFEYDLQLRDNYFNIYYKGNSLGRVSYNKTAGHYNISINHKFVNDRIINRFKPKRKNDYFEFSLPSKQLHPLFSSQNLSSMGQRVKVIAFQEETTFEQMLMTDNMNREDIIIIDRQVIDRVSKTKMDLLTLRKKTDREYQFCVVEVKLGNNPELKSDVIQQLNGYIERISSNFEEYKTCYTNNLRQKQEMGLIDKNLHVSIVPGVLGVIVVLGYSGIAQKSIRELKGKDPSIKVLHLMNKIDLTKVM
jgi:hypothetical protein